MSILSLDKEYVAGTYGRFPVELVSGKGCTLTDVNGKEYIDLTSGIGVTSFGVADDTWLQAITAQAAKLPHTSNLFYIPEAFEGMLGAVFGAALLVLTSLIARAYAAFRALFFWRAAWLSSAER